MDDALISIRDVAHEHGRRKQSIFKILRRLNITPTKQRSARGRNQFVSFITQDQRRRVREELATLADDAADNGYAAAEAVPMSAGVFYLIQLEPACDPNRFKLGFTTTIDERLRHLRCSAPFARLLRTWGCKLLWEKTAIECATAGCDQLHTEVFRTASLAQVIQRCEAFFSLMPQVAGIAAPAE